MKHMKRAVEERGPPSSGAGDPLEVPEGIDAEIRFPAGMAAPTGKARRRSGTPEDRRGKDERLPIEVFLDSRTLRQERKEQRQAAGAKDKKGGGQWR